MSVQAIADQAVSFDYKFMPISDLQVQMGEDPKTGKPVVEKVIVADEPLNHSQRFWVSLFSRYGFNSAFFKYYDHAEVFQRIAQVEKNDRMRLCIERNEQGEGTLYGVSNPVKPIVVFDELMELLDRYSGGNISYNNGIVESIHIPRNGGGGFEVSGDGFVNRFMLATPIDGYGTPNIYLSVLRTACENGVVGYAKAFKSSLALGKGDDEVGPSLTRALDGFGNEEGYAAIRDRLTDAARSWASVWETAKLYEVLVKLHAQSLLVDDLGGVAPDSPYLRKLMATPLVEQTAETRDEIGTGSPILKCFHRMTGDTSRIYGLANLDALSQKRQKSLPVRCSVYEAVNFASEVSSHYAKPGGQRLLQAYVGGLITEEYDLEGTRDSYTEFSDFMIDRKLKAGLTGSEAASKN